jgi:hypothetical protein
LLLIPLFAHFVRLTMPPAWNEYPFQGGRRQRHDIQEYRPISIGLTLPCLLVELSGR